MHPGAYFFYGLTFQLFADFFAWAFPSLSLPVSSGQFYCCLLITATHTSAFHFGVMLPRSLSLKVRKLNPKTDGDLFKIVSVRNKNGTYLVILHLVPFF